MENLNSWSLEELQAKQATIAAEIQRRKNTEVKLVVYTHNCKGSAKYHMGKYEHWAKLVKSVDTTQTSGYAFIGDFLNVNYEHKLPVGSIVVETCGGDIRAYRIIEDGKEELDRAHIRSMSEFIDTVAKAVEGCE